ncbi:unnamed protein product [Periconia digitata]|uniref:Uncharacterized protein n=1 Tax=Periconia digitata TaxID=1303443 RepID=A0A9W4UK47_9PLEO|nr:unnamed protein product [Periconia digitata]
MFVYPAINPCLRKIDRGRGCISDAPLRDVFAKNGRWIINVTIDWVIRLSRRVYAIK